MRTYAIGVGVLIALGLLLIAAGQSQSSAASRLGHPAGATHILGTCPYGSNGGLFSLNVAGCPSNNTCVLTTNDTSGVPYEAYVPNENGHGYRFGIYCPPDPSDLSNGILVARTRATYDFPSQTATEDDVQVLEGNARVTTKYHCSTDPWEVQGLLASVHPTCSRLSVNSSGSPSLCGDDAYVANNDYNGFVCDDPVDLPYSVALLSDASRDLLYAAINQAELAAFAPPSASASPAPTAMPVVSTLGTPVPSGLSGFAGAAEQVLKPAILSPTPNEVVPSTFGVNVVRQVSPQSNDVFTLEWQFQPAGSSTWIIDDTGLPAQLDKSQNPNGVAVQSFLLTAVPQCHAAACQWRLRARLSGSSIAPWSDPVQFSAQ